MILCIKNFWGRVKHGLVEFKDILQGDAMVTTQGKLRKKNFLLYLKERKSRYSNSENVRGLYCILLKINKRKSA